MSGIEAAGLALGVLPLLIAAAEHYDTCLRPIARFREFGTKARKLQTLLDIQRRIFRNHCRILLEGVIEHDVAVRMLDLVGHSFWSDVGLAADLDKLLGQSKDACSEIIEIIESQLRHIEDESHDLETTIEQETTVSIDEALSRHLNTFLIIYAV